MVIKLAKWDTYARPRGPSKEEVCFTARSHGGIVNVPWRQNNVAIGGASA
jgi:hypothetical protein